jgi:hypothetical protein
MNIIKLEKFKEQMKDQLNIFSITEEKEKLYIFIDNNEEILSKIDKLILSDELYTQKEGIIQGHGKPTKQDELLNLFKMEKSIYKILFETLEGHKGKAQAFFVKLII